MERSALRWTMALPLAPSGGPLGALALGVGRSGRRYGADDLAFARAAGRPRRPRARQRAARQPADGATQRRLDGILGALAEAVTVQTPTAGSSTPTRRRRGCSGCPACTRC